MTTETSSSPSEIVSKLKSWLNTLKCSNYNCINILLFLLFKNIIKLITIESSLMNAIILYW